MKRSETRNRIRSLLWEETVSSIKPDIVCQDEGIEECIKDELLERAKDDLVPNFYSVRDRSMEPYGDRMVPRDEYYLSGVIEKVVGELEYIVDATAYYDFQQSEENDVEALKKDFKSDIPSGTFYFGGDDLSEPEWEFKVYPDELREVDGCVYIIFHVDVE